MEFLSKLDDVIADRKCNPSEGSYTASLFSGGLDRILRKVGEETGEFIIGAKNQDKEEMTNEAADLLYHMMVALHASDLSLKDVEDVLRDRHFDLS